MANKKMPDFRVTAPVEGKDDNTYWQDIGAAWVNAEKEQISIKLNALPIGDTLVLVKPKPKPEPEQAKSAFPGY